MKYQHKISKGISCWCKYFPRKLWSKFTNEKVFTFIHKTFLFILTYCLLWKAHLKKNKIQVLTVTHTLHKSKMLAFLFLFFFSFQDTDFWLSTLNVFFARWTYNTDVFRRNLSTDWDSSLLWLQEIRNFLLVAPSSTCAHPLFSHPATKIKFTGAQTSAYFKGKEPFQYYLLHIFVKQ